MKYIENWSYSSTADNFLCAKDGTHHLNSCTRVFPTLEKPTITVQMRCLDCSTEIPMKEWDLYIFNNIWDYADLFVPRPEVVRALEKIEELHNFALLSRCKQSQKTKSPEDHFAQIADIEKEILLNNERIQQHLKAIEKFTEINIKLLKNKEAKLKTITTLFKEALKTHEEHKKATQNLDRSDLLF